MGGGKISGVTGEQVHTMIEGRETDPGMKKSLIVGDNHDLQLQIKDPLGQVSI